MEAEEARWVHVEVMGSWEQEGALARFGESWVEGMGAINILEEMHNF